MADPKVSLKKVQVTGYTGIQAGVVKSPTDNAYLSSGAILGGEANYRGTFLRGQVQAGTSFGAKLELGHTFDIGRNMGLELSAKTQIDKSLMGNNTYTPGNQAIKGYTCTVDTQTNTTSVVETQALAHSNYSASWKSGETRTGLAAKFTFGSQKAKFGVGVEGGIRNGNRPTMTYSYESNDFVDMTVDGKKVENESHYSCVVGETTKSGAYITPTLSADIKLGKRLSFNANADLHQGFAGIRYNF